MNDKIDIGNVRGIKGEKGDRGEQGKTPSYDDLKYDKDNDGEFIPIMGTGNITQYYLDANGDLCTEDGYLLDENKEVTNVLGTPFDINEYGYAYKPVWIDEEDNFTNENGERIDENGNVIYASTSFINDILSYLYDDNEAYTKLITDIYPNIVNTLISADPNDESFRDFFDEIEGDIKYYICEDDPETSIYLDGNTVVNTCKYLDADGNIVLDDNSEYAYVPLEKNALYLYNNHGLIDNEVMHYDVYVCTKSGTVPKKLISSNDFAIDYNVIDDLAVILDPEQINDVDDYDVYLKLFTRGTRGQFYSMSDIDQLFANNVIDKLGENNGIAQLDNNGTVPSIQLPPYGKLQTDGQVGTTAQKSKNVVTDSNGKITTENKYTHPATHSTALIVEPYQLSNLNLAPNKSQSEINRTIDSALGNISNLGAMEIVDSLPTASASTMGKLYLLNQNNGVSVYYSEETTIGSNTNYDWVELDGLFENIGTGWNSISDKPSTFTPSSHTHGEISNDGKITTETEASDVDGIVVTETDGTVKYIDVLPIANVNTTTLELNTNKKTSWASTSNLSDDKYPSERLVKTSLDTKSDTNHTHQYLVERGAISDSESTSPHKDLDNYFVEGFYRINGNSAKWIQHYPKYGAPSRLDVKVYRNGDANVIIFQLCYTSESNGKMGFYYRKGNGSYTTENDTLLFNGTWGEWSEVNGLDGLPTVDGTTLQLDTDNNIYKIKDGGVGTTQIANNSVTSAKIVDATITNSDIANTTIKLAKLNSDVYDTTNGGTSGSKKLITSGAVYNGLATKSDSNHSHGLLSNDGTLNNPIQNVKNVLVTDNDDNIGTVDISYWEIVPIYKHWTNNQGVYEEIDSMVLRINKVLHLAMLQVFNENATFKPGLSQDPNNNTSMKYLNAIPEGYRPIRQVSNPCVSVKGRILIDSSGDIFFVSNDGSEHTGENASTTMMWYFE